MPVAEYDLPLAGDEREFAALDIAYVGDQRALRPGRGTDGRGTGFRSNSGGTDSGSTGTCHDEKSSPSGIVHDSTSVRRAGSRSTEVVSGAPKTDV